MRRAVVVFDHRAGGCLRQRRAPGRVRQRDLEPFVQLAHEITRRLLDVALSQMKDSARRTRSEEALDWEYQRFLDNQ